VPAAGGVTGLGNALSHRTGQGEGSEGSRRKLTMGEKARKKGEKKAFTPTIKGGSHRRKNLSIKKPKKIVRKQATPKQATTVKRGWVENEKLATRRKVQERKSNRLSNVMWGAYFP